MDVVDEVLALGPERIKGLGRGGGSLVHELDRVGRLNEVAVLGPHLRELSHCPVAGEEGVPWSAAPAASARPPPRGADISPAARALCASEEAPRL